MRENMGMYRGKRIDNGEWIVGSLIKVTLNGKTFYHIFEDNFTFNGKRVKALNCALVDPETVGQYTGLTDKNGNKIFEGDVVRFTSQDYMGFNECGCVVFRAGCYGINYMTEIAKRYGWGAAFHRIGEVDEWQDMGARGTITYTYEVIGNIHDNPELLGGAK